MALIINQSFFYSLSKIRNEHGIGTILKNRAENYIFSKITSRKRASQPGSTLKPVISENNLGENYFHEGLHQTGEQKKLHLLVNFNKKK